MTENNVGGYRFVEPWHGATADALSAACGMAWGLLAYYLIENSRQTLGVALVIWEAIGVVIGRLARPAATRGHLVHAWVSLRDLYLAVTLFAVAEWAAAASWTLVGAGWYSESLINTILIMLLGLTFWGFVIVLWPLSYITHRLVWWAAPSRSDNAPDASTGLAA
jgi:hypothetical protein